MAGRILGNRKIPGLLKVVPASLLAAGLLLALLFLTFPEGIVLPAGAQEATPMAAPSFPVDDEPEGTPEEVTPPVMPPADADAARAGAPLPYPAVTFPLPPGRPGAARQQVALPSVPPAPPAAAGSSAPSPAYPVATMPSPPLRPGMQSPVAVAEEPVAPPPPPVAARSGWPAFLQRAQDEPEIELTPNMRIASLPVVSQPATTAEIEAEEQRAPEPTLVEKQTDYVNIACLQPGVMQLVRQAGEHFGGTPVITSGQRDRGRRGSFHRRCMAADFFVQGVERAVLARYLRSLSGAGGVGTYCHTKSVHIDTGEPRNWYQCGRRFRFAQR